MNITEQILLDCGFTKTHTHRSGCNLFQKGEFKITHLIKSNTHFISLKSGCVVYVDTFEKLQELYMEETGQFLTLRWPELSNPKKHEVIPITRNILMDWGFKEWASNWEADIFVLDFSSVTFIRQTNSFYIVDHNSQSAKQIKTLDDLIPTTMNANLSVLILKIYGFQEVTMDDYTHWAKKPMAKEKPPVAIGWSEGEFFFEDYHGKTLKTINELAELYHVLTGEKLTPVKS